MQSDIKAVEDKAFFRELEALYLLRLLLISCTSSLETCAFELRDASTILTARLQSKQPIHRAAVGHHAEVC